MKRLLPYAQLVRLPNTFTAMADIFLGALATQMLWSRLHVLVCLLAGSTLLYWSGMIWNDYFDLDQDRMECPGRPLASGRITLRTAFWLGIACMIGGVCFGGLADYLGDSDRWRALPIAAALVIAIFLYDGVLKATFAGPIMMGLCRSFNILLGLSILGDRIPFWGWWLAIIVGIYIAGVAWFARTEAQMSSQPMLIAAAIVIFISLTLALTVPALALELDFRPSGLFPYLLALFGGYLGIAMLRAIRRPDAARVQPAIKRAILGLVVLDALLASAFIGPRGLLLAVLLIPGMILGRWLYST